MDVSTDRELLSQLVSASDAVLHLAAQVAVTLSVKDPGADMRHNLMSTLNVLESVRHAPTPPIVIYSSTNKVYGESADIPVKKTKDGYRFIDLPHGISEKHQLSFHSPYGCSKGAADQYICDYARIYGIPTVVFRQSCIYGTRQFGSEDQGWVAWFAIQAALGNPVSIYGDGFQTRDILHVDDLCRAYELAIRNISKAKGHVYNLGGGKDNQLSVLGLVGMLGKMHGREMKLGYSDWRPGDQKVFVCDIRKAQDHLGWNPKIDAAKGIKSMVRWINDHKQVFEKMYGKR
jgi:CDP-paratose 2-epimerase